MRIYNTRSQQLEDLPPPGPLGMYVCGPTVYQRIHVGNARPFVISMWLKRWLQRRGYVVTLVERLGRPDHDLDELMAALCRITKKARKRPALLRSFITASELPALL